jgi:Phosphotransferase enzyme family
MAVGDSARSAGPLAHAAGAPDEYEEVELHGGTANRGLVVRVGDTVRRPPGAGSQGVHALLRHLERVGFDGAPRYLGEDEQGREVLTYIEGRVPIAPYPDWALTDEALVGVARLLKRYHRAVASFDPRPYRWGSGVPARWRTGLLSHNDPNLDNIVFRGTTAVALIDFDLASPGSALWDVALAARLWVPLRDPADVPDDRAQRPVERLRLFADAYGVRDEQLTALVAAARASHTWCYDTVRAGAYRGQAGYAEYWTPSAQAHDLRGQRWLDTHEHALAEGVLSRQPERLML